MRGDNAILRTRLYLIGACILLAGLGVGAWVYFSAREGPADALGYEMAGDRVYAISPGESKAYRHDLEVYGGKAALMADDFNRWFESLWQGKSLAYTLATLAAGLALVCFVAAARLPRDTSLEYPEPGPEE